MKKFSQNLYESIISTSKHPRWWILASVQVLCLAVIVAVTARPALLFSPFSVWFIISLAIIAFITVHLWLDIEARKLQTVNKLSWRVFWQEVYAFAAIMLLTISIEILARALHNDWVFLALISSLVVATSLLAMMFVVLCQLGAGRALALALSTWNRKFSLAATMSFILIILQAVSFAVWHGFQPNFSFELLSHSATIWVLLPIFAVSAIAAAFLNILLVNLFLDTVIRKKDQETEALLAKQALLEPNL